MSVIYLCYISKSMSVKAVSELLGYKHDSIKASLYTDLREMAVQCGMRDRIKTEYKRHNFKTLRVVKLKNIDPGDVEAWLMTLGLNDASFIPLCCIKNTDILDDMKKRNKELMVEHQQDILDVATAHLSKYIKQTGFTIGSNGRIMGDYSLHSKLSKKELELKIENQKQIRKEFANELKDNLIEIKL